MSIPGNSSLVQYISNNIILFLVVYAHQKLSYERLSIQVRFINNIPLQCRKINWPRTLHCIAYCCMVISLAWMKLLQFVYTCMCVKLVVCLY